MEPFNIKINSSGQTVVLTILPTDKGFYKVIYYAAILTAVKQTAAGVWMLMPKEDIEAGDLPFYIAGHDPEKVELILDSAFLQEIGAAIEVELAAQA